MKGIKALAADCHKYLQERPNAKILLTISQIDELKESRSMKPFILDEEGKIFFQHSNGRIYPIEELKIK